MRIDAGKFSLQGRGSAVSLQEAFSARRMEVTMFKHLKRDGSFYKQLLALSVPILLQNLINSSLSMADTVMVGTLGQNELAGMSLANTPFFVAMLFVFGLQSGGAVLISQYWGKHDTQTISRVIGISWYFAGAVSFIFTTIIFLFPEQVMGLTTNNPELLEVAVRYGRIVSYSYFINSIVTVYVGAQRSCENPKIGMFIVIFSMLLNVFLNWVLIFGKLGAPRLGIEGAAWATLFSRIAEFIIMLVYIAVDKHLKLHIKNILKPGKLIVGDFIRYSTPVIINETLWGFGSSLYPVIYGHMIASADIVAAYSIAGNIERIISVAVFAVANATAVIIGKEIGVGRSKDEVFSLGKTLASLSGIIGLGSGLLLAGVLFAVVRPLIFPLFALSANAERIATTMLIIISAMLVFRSFNTTLIVGILRGGGDVKSGLYLDVGAMYLWAIPLAAVTGLIFHWDISIVYMLIVSEEFIKSIIGFIRFRSGKWIRNVTRNMAEA